MDRTHQPQISPTSQCGLVDRRHHTRALPHQPRQLRRLQRHPLARGCGADGDLQYQHQLRPLSPPHSATPFTDSPVGTGKVGCTSQRCWRGVRLVRIFLGFLAVGDAGHCHQHEYVAAHGIWRVRKLTIIADYAVVMFGGVMILAMLYFVVRARKTYAGPVTRTEAYLEGKLT